MDWKLVRAEQVVAAGKIVLSGGEQSPAARGLFVTVSGKNLPAKHVLRVAYCSASSLPINTPLELSSGDSSLRLLSNLGSKLAGELGNRKYA